MTTVVVPNIFSVVVANYIKSSKTQMIKDVRKQRSAFAKAFKLLSVDKTYLTPRASSSSSIGVSLRSWSRLMHELGLSYIQSRWIFEILDQNRDLV
jgi:hypothetical protein